MRTIRDGDYLVPNSQPSPSLLEGLALMAMSLVGCCIMLFRLQFAIIFGHKITHALLTVVFFGLTGLGMYIALNLITN